MHALASRATDGYEAARRKVAALVNAASDREIVWTRNATEAVNLVANTWGRDNLGPGDEVRPLATGLRRSSAVDFRLCFCVVLAAGTLHLVVHSRLGKSTW